MYPDGMAYDPTDRKLYVSDEHGDTETVIDTVTNRRVATIQLHGDVGDRSGLRKLGEGFLGRNAHVVAVDRRTHRVYFPVLTNAGPMMLVMQPTVRGGPALSVRRDSVLLKAITP